MKPLNDIQSTPRARRVLWFALIVTVLLHELLLTEGKTVYDLVPGGWDIYRLNQPYLPER